MTEESQLGDTSMLGSGEFYDEAKVPVNLCADAANGSHTNTDSHHESCSVQATTVRSAQATEEGEISYKSLDSEPTCNGRHSPTSPLVAEGRPRRAKKRKSSGQIEKVSCPICGCNLKFSEIDGHIETEVYRLERTARNARSKYSTESKASINNPAYIEAMRVSSEPMPGPSTDVDTEDGACLTQEPWLESPARYKSYLKVKTNRERRSVRRTKLPHEEETNCPVCNRQIIGPPAEVADHVDACLRMSEQSVDVVGDEAEDEFTYEEYTWAGQTRIRTSTMLPGGLGASGFHVNKRSQDADDDDIELDVDGDDDVKYGTDQYGEADLIPCPGDKNVEGKGKGKPQRDGALGCARSDSGAPGSRTPQPSTSGYPLDTNKGSPNYREYSASSSWQIIESLKAKIRDQAKQITELTDIPKCLICMEKYSKPVASVQCWHVHCEECWLRTLGSKKLCPQCNLITAPGDLRRIYL